MASRSKVILSLCFLRILIGFAVAQTQPLLSSSDPYRGFIGDWTGTILVNPDRSPNNVVLTISEMADGTAMLWDYRFGKQGQPGYKHVSKVVVLLPGQSELRSRWTGEKEITLTTSGLENFVKSGTGEFSATETVKRWSFRGKTSVAVSKVTYRLTPSQFGYVWWSSEGRNSTVYSHFEFTRVTQAATKIPDRP
jgi:hypothetical protein